MTAPLRFRGIDRRGNDRLGAPPTGVSPAELIERFYQAGFKSLTVWRGDVVVGQITTRFDGAPARAWWAET